MTTLPILPLVISLIGAPAAAPPAADPAAADPAVHPHHHKVSIVPCVKGKVTVRWFTVPFNPKEVKDNVRPNYVWSRGFSLETDVKLKCGDVELQPGRYSLAFQVDGEAKNWSVVLAPAELRRLQFQIRRARRSGDDVADLEAKMKAMQKRRHKLKSETFKGTHAEHMSLIAMNHGYPVASRRDATPIGGVKAEVRVSFGDMHTSFAFEEVLGKEASTKKEPAKVGR